MNTFLKNDELRPLFLLIKIIKRMGIFQPQSFLGRKIDIFKLIFKRYFFYKLCFWFVRVDMMNEPNFERNVTISLTPTHIFPPIFELRSLWLLSAAGPTENYFNI